MMNDNSDDRPDQSLTVIDGGEQPSSRRFVVREDRTLPPGVAVEVSLDALDDLGAKLSDLDYEAKRVAAGEVDAITAHTKALHEVALSSKRLFVSRAEIAMLGLSMKDPGKE